MMKRCDLDGVCLEDRRVSTLSYIHSLSRQLICTITVDLRDVNIFLLTIFRISPIFFMQTFLSICTNIRTCIGQLLRRGYAWACERLYHEMAWEYDLVSHWVSLGRWDVWRRTALRAIEAYGKPAGLPMLEIGFGTGDLLIVARRQGLPVIGLELSSQMHAVTSAKMTKEKLDAPRVQATASTMPFGDGSFSALIATFPAPFLLEPVTLRECARVLSERGLFVVVGLWVTPIWAGRRINLPLLYATPSQSLLAGWRDAFTSAGFSVNIQPEVVANAEVGVLMAQKSS
jgi:SAM-dependent methyltransferase